MKQQILQISKFLIGWPISFLALFFLVRFFLSKSGTIFPTLQTANYFFIVCGVFCFLIYFFLRALLWQKILENKKHIIPYKEVCFLWASSEIKRYIPGNIWSLVTRTMLFSEKKIDKKIVFIGLLTEAKYVVLGSALLSVFSWSFALYLFFHNHTVIQPLLLISYFCFSILLYIVLYKNFHTSVALLSLAFVSFFFFSLGTYFVISSIAALSLYYFLTFLSFFSLCYVLGYLAFITPMGLGVREGVMALGLSRFVSLPLSGLGAIFARVMLVVVEILFLFLVYAWYKTKNKIIANIESFTQKNWHSIILIFCICLYCVYFTFASFARYENFYTGRFDLGNMDQTVWNTFRGRAFVLTDPNGTEIISRLAFHADFILIALAPLYRIWPDPRMLLLVQTLVVSAGAVFVFLIAKNVLKEKKISLLLSILFLLNPSIQHANLFDFHAVTLVTTFLLGAFYFLQEKKYLWFLFFALLSGLTKENIWLVVSFLGLYLFIQAKKSLAPKILGLALCVGSMILFYYLVWYAIPHARGGNHFVLSYYSDFGDSPNTIIKNILFSPAKTLATVIQIDRINYIFELLFPLGFLSLLAPSYLFFILPDTVMKLLSSNVQLHQIYFQYTAPASAFLFIATIYGVRKIIRIFPNLRILLLYYLISMGLLASYFLGPLPIARNPNLAMFTSPQKDKDTINNFLSGIRKRYSVAATNNLGSHLSRRQRIYTIPLGLEKADVIVFLLNDPFAQPSLAAQRKMVKDLKKNKKYTLLIEKGDFVAFQKK